MLTVREGAHVVIDSEPATARDLAHVFGEAPTSLHGEVLYANCGAQGYVLLLVDGALYEVACARHPAYGLAGQWLPTRVTFATLTRRPYATQDTQDAVVEAAWAAVNSRAKP